MCVSKQRPSQILKVTLPHRSDDSPPQILLLTHPFRHIFRQNPVVVLGKRETFIIQHIHWLIIISHIFKGVVGLLSRFETPVLRRESGKTSAGNLWEKTTDHTVEFQPYLVGGFNLPL